MSDKLTKDEIRKRGRRFTAYMAIAAFCFILFCYGLMVLAAFINGKVHPEIPYIIQWGEIMLVLILAFCAALSAILSSVICWRLIMKHELTRKKATKTGRRSALLAYPILAVILYTPNTITNVMQTGSLSFQDGLFIISIISYAAFSGLAFTAILTVPIGHWIGVKITPESFEKKLAAYRAEKYGRREQRRL